MTYQEKLVKMIRATAQEVYERAEEFVANSKLITDFDIWLRFPQDGFPTIEVNKTVASRRTLDVLTGKDEDEE